MPPAVARWSETRAIRAAFAWGRRIGVAPALLAAAFLLPVPTGAHIGGIPSLCLFHTITGLPCPGCGITRSVVCCAHGLWSDAVNYHPFGPVVFATLVAAAAAPLIRLLRPSLSLVWPPRLAGTAAMTGVSLLLIIWGARLAGWLPAPP